jgi:hypothetical protein
MGKFLAKAARIVWFGFWGVLGVLGALAMTFGMFIRGVLVLVRGDYGGIFLIALSIAATSIFVFEGVRLAGAGRSSRSDAVSAFLNQGEKYQVAFPAGSIRDPDSDECVIVATDQAFVVLNRGFRGRVTGVVRRYPRNQKLDTNTPGALPRTISIRLGTDYFDHFYVDTDCRDKLEQANAALDGIAGGPKVLPSEQ